MSRARLPTRWSAAWSPMSASRSVVRSAARSAALWCAARSADCCGDENFCQVRRRVTSTNSTNSNVLRWPSLRAPLEVLFLFCCVVLTAFVLVPEIWGSGKTKDYPLWFWAGQQVLHGADLYPRDPNSYFYFEFLYPPFSAILLAIPSFFGKLPLYACLSALNIIAWWMTPQFSHAMAGSERTPAPWRVARVRHDHVCVRHVRP